MSEKVKNPHKKVRHQWERSPVEKPHSTKKGEKGYNRNKFKEKDKERLKEERG